jgi:hypothetical protein
MSLCTIYAVFLQWDVFATCMNCLRYVLIIMCLLWSAKARAQSGWEEVPTPDMEANFVDMASSQPGHLVLRISANGFPCLWSFDEGKTWSQGASQINGSGLDTEHPTDMIAISPKVLLAVTSVYRSHLEQGDEFIGEFWQSLDSGNTWKELFADSIGWTGPIQRGEDRFYFPFAGRMRSGTWDYHKAGGYLETTDGVVFTRNVYGLIQYDAYVSVAGESGFVYLANYTNSKVSSDRGQSFSSHENVRVDSDTLLTIKSLTRISSGTLLAGDDEAVYRSSDGGKQWRRVDWGRFAEFTYGFGTIYHLAYRHEPFTFNRGSDSLLHYSTDDGSSWQTWKFGGLVSAVVPVTTGLTYVLAGNKIYKREIAASINKHKPQNGELTISPNPVGNEMRLTLGGDEVSGFVAIFDVVGKEVLRSSLAADRIDVSSLPAGVYSVRVIDGDIMRTGRFVVER